MLELPIDSFLYETSNKNNLDYIPESIISKLNSIIENSGGEEKEIIYKLEILKKIAIKKYSTLKDINEKEKFLSILLTNIIELVNELKYYTTYNSDIIIGKNSSYYSDINDVLKIALLDKGNNIEGGDCNSWLYFIYELIKKITDNDKNISYVFSTKKNDNHGKLYIKINDKIFLYHRMSNHRLSLVEFIEKNGDEILSYSENNFSKLKTKVGIQKNNISYNNIDNKFNLEKKVFLNKFNYLIKKVRKKEVKFINIRGLKKISKKMYKFLFLEIYLLNRNFSNIEEIKDYIKQKIYGGELNEYIDEAFKHLNEEKLKYFFNVKDKN